MGTTPKLDKKPKYNQDDKFAWVDSQWEKFMTEQKELKARISELEERMIKDDNYIEDLEEDKGRLIDMVTELNEENGLLKKDLEDLVSRTPSKFLSKDSDYSKPEWTQEQINYWDKMIKQSIKQTMDKHLSASNQRSDEWKIEQFNRNRAPEDQVKTIEEMKKKVKELFPDKE